MDLLLSRADIRIIWKESAAAECGGEKEKNEAAAQEHKAENRPRGVAQTAGETRADRTRYRKSGSAEKEIEKLLSMPGKRGGL